MHRGLIESVNSNRNWSNPQDVSQVAYRVPCDYYSLVVIARVAERLTHFETKSANDGTIFFGRHPSPLACGYSEESGSRIVIAILPDCSARMRTRRAAAPS